MVLSDMLFNTTEDIMPPMTVFNKIVLSYVCATKLYTIADIIPPMTVFNKVLVNCKHFNIFIKVYSMTLIVTRDLHFVPPSPSEVLGENMDMCTLKMIIIEFIFTFLHMYEHAIPYQKVCKARRGGYHIRGKLNLRIFRRFFNPQTYRKCLKIRAKCSKFLLEYLTGKGEPG